MRTPYYILFIATIALLLSGCEHPDSQFVYNKRTDEMAAEVSKATKALVDENFGSPKQTVAWLRMPADYGTLKGEVVETDKDATTAYQFKVEFASPDKEGETESSVPPSSLAGLAIRWTSGRYQDGAQVDGGRRDGEQMAALHVASWNEETGILSLREQMNPSPAVGDTFEIIGHKLSFGRQLYAAHCQHCHGVSGDGNGPTARYLNPLPRDYRLGLFKFQSTPKTDKPTDDDLERIIRKGIPGTYMPSFLLLEDAELDAIVQYVKWLSMRGEYENRVINRLYSTYENSLFEETVENELKSRLEDYDASSGEAKPTTKSVRQALLEDKNEDFSNLPEISDDESKTIEQFWTSMTVVIPKLARVPDTPESRARGRVLYIKNCAACHGATGKGDGEQVDAYNVIPNTTPPVKYDEPGLFDDWGNSIKPRNLTRGIYRGGRRPIDLYRRIFEGINGTPMPAFKGKFDRTDKEKDDAGVWDVVNYIYHLPFETRADKPSKPHAQHEKKTAAAKTGP